MTLWLLMAILILAVGWSAIELGLMVARWKGATP